MEVASDITNDVETWSALFSEYSVSQTSEQRGETVRFRLALHRDENGIVWSWVSERTTDPASRTVRSARVETGVFKYMSLFWEYTEVEGGVNMRWVQDFEMKPVAPINDEQMTARLNGNTAIQMQLIKQKVEAAAAQKLAS